MRAGLIVAPAFRTETTNHQTTMKMKRVLWAALATLVAGFTAHAAPTAASRQEGAPPPRVLIAYYSWSGHTRIAAEQIQQATGGVLFEIRPSEAYPAAYRECTERAKREIEAGYRPALQGMPDHLESFDVVFVGSPNWWSSIAPPVASFLASGAWQGKTVVPFVTHGGGGMAGCAEAMQRLCPQARVLPGRAFPGGNIRNLGGEVAAWARQIITHRQ